MILIPPPIESFSAVAASLCLGRAIWISRDYIQAESIRWKKVLPGIIPGQCAWTIQYALRRGLLTFAGIALLSASPSEFTFAELFGVLVTGPLTAGHAVAAVGALLVYAYQIGKQVALPWPLVARTAQSVLSGALFAFCLGAIELPVGVDALAHAFRLAVVPALSIFALLPLYRLVQGHIEVWGNSLHDAFPERLPRRKAVHAPGRKAFIDVETSLVPDKSSLPSLRERGAATSPPANSTERSGLKNLKNLPPPGQGELFTFFTKSRRRKK